jgi:DNA adenine methylase
MLFYLDPPYFGCESDYGPGVFCRDDFERLAGILGQARGQFLLSINDHPVVRECFGAFHISEVETTWSISTAHGGAKAVQELIISNFQP